MKVNSGNVSRIFNKLRKSLDSIRSEYYFIDLGNDVYIINYYEIDDTNNKTNS